MIIDYLPPCFFHPNSHSLACSRFVCFFLCFPPRLYLWFPKSTHQAPKAPPRVNFFSARCPGFFWDDPTGIGFSPPLFAMLLCAVIALLRTLLDGHFSSSSFFFFRRRPFAYFVSCVLLPILRNNSRHTLGDYLSSMYSNPHFLRLHLPITRTSNSPRQAILSSCPGNSSGKPYVSPEKSRKFCAITLYAIPDDVRDSRRTALAMMI